MTAQHAEDIQNRQGAPRKEADRSVRLPIRYRDAETMMAFFPLPTRNVRGLLPSTQLRPVEAVPGYAVLAFVAFEYRDTDIGPYNEVAVCVPVLYNSPLNLPLVPLLFEKSYPGLGFYVHHLPVTTDIACRAGREIYGYPKFVADIGFEEKGGQRICHLAEGGRHILSLSVDRPSGGRSRREERGLVTYSVLEKRLLKTVVRTEMNIERRRMRGATLALGDHEVSRELRRLEISARPIESRFAERMEAVLPEPVPC